MNKTSIWKIAWMAVALIGFSACSHDELADGTLSYGKYPVTFTATGLSNTPLTRATVDGTWDKGDAVAVVVDGVNGAKKYITESSGQTVTLTAEAGSIPFYWESMQRPISVSAWYCGSQYNATLPSDWSVNENQNGSGYNQSDFLYAPPTDITYNGNQSLNFYHQTAKVVVNIRNYGVATNEPNFVNIHAIKDGGFDVNANGNFRLSAKGTTYSSIQPQKLTVPNAGVVFKQGDQGETALASYQALVIPQTLSNSAAIEINIDGYAPFKYIPTGEWKGGNVYAYNISVNAQGLEVAVDNSIPWGAGGSGSGSVTIIEPVDLTTYPNEVYTVAQGETAIIDGKGNVLEKRLVINEGAQVTLKNVKLNEPYAVKTPVIEVTGTATINISGTDNVITSCANTDNDAICVTGANATLTINGTLEDKLTLDASACSNAAALGAKNSANIIINGGTIIATAGDDAAAIGSNYNSTCGNITINGGHITANAGKNSAAIGGGSNAGQCGDITITGGTVIANGSDEDLGSVGIGSGTGTQTTMPTCGYINISGGNITATGGSGMYGGAGIGAGVNTAYCQDITITGGNVTAIGKSGTKLTNGEYGSGAGIGTSCYGQCDNIKISGANTTVIATAGGDKSYDIGLGYDPENPDLILIDGVVEIASEAKVTATNGRIYGH